MQCPACKSEMFVLEFDLVEIDYCLECRGVWLDSGELEMIGERAGAVQKELLTALDQGRADRGAAEEKRRCPVCRKVLRRADTGGKNPIVLDRCPKRHGIWFDRGELQGVIKAAGAESDNILARFLARLESGGDDGEGQAEEGSE